MSALGRTWELYKQSFAVLSADVEILLLPVMSAAAAILLGVSFFVPMYQVGTLKAIARAPPGGPTTPCCFPGTTPTFSS